MQSKLILLADDHVIIRRGLKLLLDNYFNREMLIEAQSLQEIQLQLSKHPITHMILDMQLQDGNVIEILPTISKNYPNVQILIYTMGSEDIFGAKMLKMGATSFLSKQSDEEEVVKALNLFLSGRQYLSNNLKDILTDSRNQKENPLQSLSERELSVLGRLLKGESVKEISNQLNLKATTVATYKARIFEKLGVNNLIDLNNIADLNNFQTP